MTVNVKKLNSLFHTIASRIGYTRSRMQDWEESVESSPSPFVGHYGDTLVQNKKHCMDFATPLCPTTNLGDDIQAIAQLGFVPRGSDILGVDREYLHSYRGSPRILIANGWYLFRANHWPPAPALRPVFVSFHLANDQLLIPEKVAYLKQHAPIGCRDTATVRKLSKAGVEAYFSGCLTLTLRNPNPPSLPRTGVVICDADLGYDDGYPPSAKSLLHKLVPPEIIREATWTKHECSPGLRYEFRRKRQLAESCLELYAKARLVITTRLHCALPCLAFGTPVVFLNQYYKTDPRFDGFREYLNGYGPGAERIDMDWNNPAAADITAVREKTVQMTLTAIQEKIVRLEAAI